MLNNNDCPVSNPTYMQDIRYFFESQDISCMRGQGIDLATYEGVKLNALRIYFRVKEGSMPPQSDRRWSEGKVETFYNWMKNDYPRGVVEPNPFLASPRSVSRLRKNITQLSQPEIDLLKKAFSVLMQRSPDDPQSYFALAGIHWLPGPEYCRHHENAYNPWHRIYLLRFEDALRSVEGCENITLPYWDITEATVPSVLYEEPFATYTIPRELCSLSGQCYSQNYVTQRNTTEKIIKELQERTVPSNVSEALGYSHWENFNGWANGGRTQDGIIKAHDNGHNSCGITMQNQDIAAFDPIFWFFHANWDRLWWKWQQMFEATTLSQFKTHLSGAADWLDDPVLNKLPPFAETTAQSIDLFSFDVDYIHPVSEQSVNMIKPRFGNFVAGQPFELSTIPKVSVRVKGIDRLAIPGSFDVLLQVGDQVIAKQGFFQSTASQHCETCRKKGLINIDFLVEQSDLLGGKIQVLINLLRSNGTTTPFPLSSCGNPTINIRLLLEQ